jgi:hypothetical protein
MRFSMQNGRRRSYRRLASGRRRVCASLRSDSVNDVVVSMLLWCHEAALCLSNVQQRASQSQFLLVLCCTDCAPFLNLVETGRRWLVLRTGAGRAPGNCQVSYQREPNFCFPIDQCTAVAKALQGSRPRAVPAAVGHVVLFPR